MIHGVGSTPVTRGRGKVPHSLLLSPFIHAFLTDTTQSSSRENSGSTSQVSQTASGVWTTMSNITASPLSGLSGTRNTGLSVTSSRS